MAVLTIHTLPVGGLETDDIATFSYEAAAASGGDSAELIPSSGAILRVQNTGAGSVIVTIPGIQPCPDGSTTDDNVVTVLTTKFTDIPLTFPFMKLLGDGSYQVQFSSDTPADTEYLLLRAA